MKRSKFTLDEKKVLKSLVKYHLKEVKKDRRGLGRSLIVVIGIEEKYEDILKRLLKKL